MSVTWLQEKAHLRSLQSVCSASSTPHSLQVFLPQLRRNTEIVHLPFHTHRELRPIMNKNNSTEARKWFGQLFYKTILISDWQTSSHAVYCSTRSSSKSRLIAKNLIKIIHPLPDSHRESCKYKNILKFFIIINVSSPLPTDIYLLRSAISNKVLHLLANMTVLQTCISWEK